MGERVSVLESRHVELGAQMVDWNDIAVAWTYYTDTDEEHAAVREAAGLFDMSGLRKVHIKGPDAFDTVQYLSPRDMSKIYVGKSAFSLILTKDGGIEDDAIIYRLADDHYLVVFGTGGTAKQLEYAARDRDVKFWLDDDMHCLSFQGPKSAEVMEPHTPMDLKGMKYFHHEQTTLFGEDVLIARTGYTGERGYDLFVPAKSAGKIWDGIMAEGKSEGVLACSFVCLNVVRIEAGLHFHPYDMCPDTTPWEAELGWSVSTRKDDYLGKTGIMKNRGNQRFYFCGIEADHDEAFCEPLGGGEKIYAYGKEAGTMTSGIYSERLRKAIGFAHLHQFAAAEGTPLVIHGKATVTGKVVPLPFYDPEKKKARAK